MTAGREPVMTTKNPRTGKTILARQAATRTGLRPYLSESHPKSGISAAPNSVATTTVKYAGIAGTPTTFCRNVKTKLRTT